VPPRSEDWNEFYSQVKRRTGLDLHLYKQDQLQRRILSMVDTKGTNDLRGFWGAIGATESDVQWFLDKLAINVSELFRNPEKWHEVETKILPELLKGTNRLKCWSAGCSYGAEAHTLAAILDKNFAGAHQIIGSDIDMAALNQAKAGEFGDNDVRFVPEAYRTRYFEKTAQGYKAKADLKRYLTFRKGDLLGDRFESGFDMILCRNVVIYFTDPAKEVLYRKFYEALKPGGYLFVGSTERIFSAKEIGFTTTIPFFYQKPMEGTTQQWRNAS
jgi:chemotaxis protein methyltransferase CheR